MSSGQLFHGPCLWSVAHSPNLWFFCECATPPHIHPTPRYIIACDQIYQAFPVLVLQVTNAGVRRPGYKAKMGYHRTGFDCAVSTLCLLGVVGLRKQTSSLVISQWSFSRYGWELWLLNKWVWSGSQDGCSGTCVKLGVSN